MGGLAPADIGDIERGHIEVRHGLTNLPSQMSLWELGIDLAPRCGLFVPRRFGKADRWLGMG
jgi:hypothetical protein